MYYLHIKNKDADMKIIQQQGFTLIEVVVVIAILGIVAVMAIPSFVNTVNKNKLSTEAREFVNYLTETRVEAILKQKNHQVTLTGTSPDWIPKNDVVWLASHPSVNSVTYNAMGRLESTTNLCFILVSAKNSNYKAVITARRTGSVVYDKNLSTCVVNPTDD